MAIEQFGRRDPARVQVPNDQQEALVGGGEEMYRRLKGGAE